MTDGYLQLENIPDFYSVQSGIYRLGEVAAGKVRLEPTFNVGTSSVGEPCVLASKSN